jgi:hypothetical protein
MTSGGRLAVIGLACLQVSVWTCPAYCVSAAESALAAAAPEVAATHEHHHSGTAHSQRGKAVSIDAVPAGCCGNCGAEEIPQSITEKYSGSGNGAANAIVPLAFSLVSVQRSAGIALPHQPPGTSPPGACVSPLRI